MASYRRQVSISFGGPLTPAVKYIIIATAAVFTVQLLSGALGWGWPPRDPLTAFLGLHPSEVVSGFQIWRLVTWLFVHGSVPHILFNMLFLFMFGCQLERLWGTRFFAHYYFVCGIAAGLFTFLPFQDFFHANHIGASGAIYAVLMAYGLTFPRNVIYFMLVFPIEARYFVLILGVLTFWFSLGSSPGVSHIAHLGGLAAGYLYLRTGLRHRAGGDAFYALRDAYRRWRLKRLRRKFEQYYERRGGRTHYDVH